MNDPEPSTQENDSSHSIPAEELVTELYTELKRIAAIKMAKEHGLQTLQATGLVHEAWLRLGDGCFANRLHFFAAASEAMRRILIERARRKQREKHGGGAAHIPFDDIEVPMPQGNEDEAIAVHEVLDQFAAAHPQKAELVKLRYFVGLPFDAVADLMGMSLASAKRDWAYARAWLHRKLSATD